MRVRAVLPFEAEYGQIYVYKKAYDAVMRKKDLFTSVEVKNRQLHIIYHNKAQTVKGCMILKNIGSDGRGIKNEAKNN